MSAPSLSEMDPEGVWRALSSDRSAILIDVRTNAEWSFVGTPDLSSLQGAPVLIEWQRYPDMSVDPDFAGKALRAARDAVATSAYFICRSGVRSMYAATAVAQECARAGGTLACVNVVSGFEGDLDETGRRGRINGWKADGLPWRQA